MNWNRQRWQYNSKWNMQQQQQLCLSHPPINIQEAIIKATRDKLSRHSDFSTKLLSFSYTSFYINTTQSTWHQMKRNDRQNLIGRSQLRNSLSQRRRKTTTTRRNLHRFSRSFSMPSYGLCLDGSYKTFSSALLSLGSFAQLPMNSCRARKKCV